MRERIMDLAGDRPIPVRAETFLQKWDSASAPRVVLCSDGERYVLKGAQVGRGVAADHIVAHLGVALDAPVGIPALIEVTQDLLDIEPQMRPVPAGMAHGTRFIPDTTDKVWLDRTDAQQPENRRRLAVLAVLYGWTVAGDHQLIRSLRPPPLIYSVDHGHFFPGGPQWDPARFGAAPAPAAYQPIVHGAGLTSGELEPVIDLLHDVSDEEVLRAVAMPLAEWGITLDDRVAVAEFLLRRRDAFARP